MIWKRGGAQLRDPLILVRCRISSVRLPLLTATFSVPGSWYEQEEQRILVVISGVQSQQRVINMRESFLCRQPPISYYIFILH